MTAYLTIAQAQHYASARHISLAAIDNVTLAALLLRASELIDTACVFQGTKQSPTQSRSWPRRNAYDENHHLIVDIPQALQAVTLELAILLSQDEAEAMRALGLAGGIHKERIGDVHISYDRNAKHILPFLRRLWHLLAASQPIYVRRG